MDLMFSIAQKYLGHVAYMYTTVGVHPTIDSGLYRKKKKSNM